MLAWRSRPFCGALFITLVCAQTDGVVQGTVPALMSAERASPTPISVAPSQNWFVSLRAQVDCFGLEILTLWNQGWTEWSLVVL
jgi:hypothetical protein